MVQVEAHGMVYLCKHFLASPSSAYTQTTAQNIQTLEHLLTRAGHHAQTQALATKPSGKYFLFPGFPDQADHNLTILWHHTNHTNFLTMILP